MAATPDGTRLLVSSRRTGGIFAEGDARFFLRLDRGYASPAFPVVGMAATPDGRGYWLVTLIGQVYSFRRGELRGKTVRSSRCGPLTAGIVFPRPAATRIVDGGPEMCFVHNRDVQREAHPPLGRRLVGAG